MSCNDPLHAGANYARHYQGPSDSAEGKLVNQEDEPGCSVGGIIISPRGMLTFLHALSRTDKIVNRDTWALMARPGEDRYGWPEVPTVPIDPAFKQQDYPDRAFGHNGSRWGGKAKGQVIVFPNGMSAVAVVNSKGSEGAPALQEVLLAAYEAVLPNATVSGSLTSSN